MWLFADTKIKQTFDKLLKINNFYFFIFLNILISDMKEVLQNLMNINSPAPLPLIIPFELTYQFAVQLVG